MTVEREQEGAGTAAAARDRDRPLRVVVSAEERAQIVGRAEAAKLSISAYLRTVGLGYAPRSMLDQHAIIDVVKVAADQKRLGGLLKLWLSEKPGQGASTFEVRRVLRQIETMQQELRVLVGQLKGRRHDR